MIGLTAYQWTVLSGIGALMVAYALKSFIDARLSRRVIAALLRSDGLMARSDKLLGYAEVHGEITDRNQARTKKIEENVSQKIEEATTRAEIKATEVASTATQNVSEHAEDLKKFVIDKITALEKHVDERIEHLERLIREGRRD